MRIVTPFEIILEMVCRLRRISSDEVRSTSRLKRVCKVRFEIYWLARDLTNLSTTEIGAALGGRDHTSVLGGIKRQTDRIAHEPFYFMDFEQLRSNVLKELTAASAQNKFEFAREDGLALARKVMVPGNFGEGIGYQQIVALARKVLEQEEQLITHRKFAKLINDNVAQFT